MDYTYIIEKERTIFYLFHSSLTCLLILLLFYLYIFLSIQPLTQKTKKIKTLHDEREFARLKKSY